MKKRESMGQLLRLWTYVNWERKILNGWRENNVIISTRWFSLHNFQVLEDVISYWEVIKYHEINFIIHFTLGFQLSESYFASWLLCGTLQSQYFDTKANMWSFNVMCPSTHSFRNCLAQSLPLYEEQQRIMVDKGIIWGTF